MPNPFLLSVFLLTAIASLPLLADEWNKRFPCSATCELRLEAGDGAVVVTPSASNAIEARIETVGWRIGPSEVQVVDRQMGDRVELELRVPRVRWGVGRRSIRVELRVPPSIRANLRTSDGSITVEGLKGDTRLFSGDGRIRVSDVEGALEATTNDGSIRVSGRFDSLQLNSGDGSIEADVKPGSRLNSSWRIKTGDGHVKIRLPQELAADVEAHTGDGRVVSDLPVVVTGTIRRSELRGKLNGGGPLLSVRTGDGGISLERFH